MIPDSQGSMMCRLVPTSKMQDDPRMEAGMLDDGGKLGGGPIRRHNSNSVVENAPHRVDIRIMMRVKMTEQNTQPCLP